MFVEVLRFRVPLTHQIAFLQADAEIWTPVLSGYTGFAGKEVWRNAADPEEISLAIHWTSRAQWKAIPTTVLAETEQQFQQTLGTVYPIQQSLEYQVLEKFSQSP